MSGSKRTPADEAARAGWLYYVAGMTQDQIADRTGRFAAAGATAGQPGDGRGSDSCAAGPQDRRLSGAGNRIDPPLWPDSCRVAPDPGGGATPSRIAPGARPCWNVSCGWPIPDHRLGHRSRAARDGGRVDPIEARHTDRVADRKHRAGRVGHVLRCDHADRRQDAAPHYPMPVPVISDRGRTRLFMRCDRCRRSSRWQTGRCRLCRRRPDGRRRAAFQRRLCDPRNWTEMQAAGAVGRRLRRRLSTVRAAISNAPTRLVGGPGRAGPRPPVIGVAAGAIKGPRNPGGTDRRDHQRPWSRMKPPPPLFWPD